MRDSKAWTLDQRDEYVRCSNSPLYFMQNYASIRIPTQGFRQRKNFTPTEDQTRWLREVEANRQTFVMGPRQSGTSTLMMNYALWFAMFQQDKAVAVVAPRDRQSMALMDILHYSWSNLPRWLKLNRKHSNGHEITFINRSGVSAGAINSQRHSGMFYNLVFADQLMYATPDMRKDFEHSTLAAVIMAPNTKYIEVNTK